MARTKITKGLSIHRKLKARVNSAAKKENISFSAWMCRAAERELEERYLAPKKS